MTEILLYGPIGADMWEPENAITAKNVMAQLSDVDGDVTVRISSGGGDVYEGIDIMNALKNHPGRVTVIVESLAASAASFIAVGGGDEVLMRPSSELMIHRAWTFTDGNADEVRKTLADLERQDMKLASIYAEKAGGQVDDWLDAMGAETWYTAEEAVAAGLADRVVDAKPVPEAQAPAAAIRGRFKFANRAAAPPPPVTRSESGDEKTKPSDGQKGDAMSIKNLAQELGVEPDVLHEKLSGFFNETVSITGEVDVTYPQDAKIVPTERITIDPTIGDTPVDEEPVEVVPEGTEPQPNSAAVELAKSAGLTFAMGDVADGFDASVDEGGTVTITAPSGVEVGSVAEFTVLVNDTAVPLSVTVRALSEETTEDGAEDDTPAAPDGGAAPGDVVTVPRAVWNEYMEDRARYSAKLAEDKQRALEAKVDAHIREGRYSAAHRSAAIAAYKTDPVAADKIWGALPKNVAVPMEEIGHSGDVAGMTQVEKLRAKAAANRESKKEK